MPFPPQFLEADRLLGNGLLTQNYSGTWFDARIHGADFIQVLDPTAGTAEVSWDFSGSDFRLLYIFVASDALDVFQVAGRAKNGSSEGFQPVTVDGSPIFDIAFVGTQSVPDSGATLPLLGMAVGLLALCKRRRERPWIYEQ